jgi:hypothetical protein
MDRECIVTDGAVVPAVAEAIFFMARFHGYGESVLTAVNNSDDTDTVGAITGTIAGAYCGAAGIPAEWVYEIELRDYLIGLADRIWDASEAWQRGEHGVVARLADACEDFDGLFEDGEDVDGMASQLAGCEDEDDEVEF